MISNTQMGTGPISDNLPTAARNELIWQGRTIKLIDPKQCYALFGVYPGVILKHPDLGPQEVLGASDQKMLWVKSLFHSLPFFQALPNTRNKDDLKRNNYQWEERPPFSTPCVTDQAWLAANGVNKAHQHGPNKVIFSIKGERFTVNRELLNTYTPYFEPLFQKSDKPGQDFTITLNNGDPQIFKLFFNYIHTQAIEQTKDHLLALGAFADQFQIQTLKNHCLATLSNFLTSASIFTLLQEAYVKTPSFLTQTIETHIYGSLSDFIEQANQIKDVKKALQDLTTESMKRLIQNSPKKDPMLFKLAILWCSDLAPQKLADFAQIIVPLFFPIGDFDYPLYVKALKTLPNLPDQAHFFTQTLHSTPCTLTLYAYAVGKLKWFEIALFHFGTVLEKYPEDVSALMGCAQMLYQKDHCEQAMVYYSKILQNDPLHVNAHVGYAQILFRLKQYKEGLTEISKALTVNPQDKKALSKGGHALFLIGKYEESEKYYQTLLSCYKNDKHAIKNYAYLLLFLKNYQKAKELFALAIKEDRKNRSLLIGYAETLYALEEYPEAFNQVQHVLHSHSNSKRALILHAHLLALVGDEQQADAQFAKALTLLLTTKKKSWSTLIKCANYLIKQAQWQSAEKLLEELIVFNQLSHPQKINYIEAWIELKRYDRALNLVEKLLRDDATNLKVWELKAQINNLRFN